MRKKLTFTALAVCFCAASYIGLKSFESSNCISDVQISNIEALVNGESGCNYNNGYKAYKKGQGGAYDCCGVWREMEPNTKEGNCN